MGPRFAEFHGSELSAPKMHFPNDIAPIIPLVREEALSIVFYQFLFLSIIHILHVHLDYGHCFHFF